MTHSTPLEQAISDQILALARRHEPRLTQADLADAAGVSRVTMNNYLQGKYPMPLDALVMVCDLLGVSPGQVVCLAEAQLKKEEHNEE